MHEQALAFAPGRVNLIGEHTDYNEGLALPFAIDQGVTVRAQELDSREVQATAEDLGEEDRFDLDSPAPAQGWRAFVRGVVVELGGAGMSLRGARLSIAGDLPRGAGLSSSAALEVALALAMIAVAGVAEPPRLELARICSKVENEWVGAQTGLLDQLASLYGETRSALRIDFRSLVVSPVPLELHGFRLVTVDSGERHANATSGYNQRRAECARACELLGVSSLREVSAQMASELPEPLARRARHVIGANGRVEAAVAALERGEVAELGPLLDSSHASLRDDYEVSTPAVEAAVERLHRAGALGARVIGAGFGGNVLGLLAPDVPPPPDSREVRPGAGARLLSPEQ